MSSGINISGVTLEENSNGLYNIKIESKAPVIPDLKLEQLSNKLAGLKIKAARELLTEDNNIKDFSINFNHESLPKLNFAIKMVLNKPESYQVINLKD